MFSYKDFFDTSSFQHASLLETTDFVWEALPQIAIYLNSLPLGKIEIDIPSGVFLKNKELISIGEGTVVEPGAYIQGPCFIGKNCSIRHGAYIRGNVVAGDFCVIGHASEVKNSILLNHSQAAHFAYVGDSILGNHVNLGAGTKCANLKLDDSLVIIHYNQQTYETGLRKFGAIIGDYSQTGCNSVTNPGTLLGKQVFCYPCLNISGFIPSKTIVKTNAVSVMRPFEEGKNQKRR